MSDPVRARDGSVEIAIRVQPGARRTEVAGLHGDQLKIRVASPPVDGRANAALIAFLAERIGVSPSHVRIAAGTSGRSKRVVVAGVTQDAARAALGLT